MKRYLLLLALGLTACAGQLGDYHARCTDPSGTVIYEADINYYSIVDDSTFRFNEHGADEPTIVSGSCVITPVTPTP